MFIVKKILLRLEQRKKNRYTECHGNDDLLWTQKTASVCQALVGKNYQTIRQHAISRLRKAPPVLVEIEQTPPSAVARELLIVW